MATPKLLTKRNIDRIAGGDITKFMQLYGSLVDFVRSNPGILYQK